VAMPAAGVMQGVSPATVLLFVSDVAVIPQPDLPTSVKYPLQRLIAAAGDYFTSTVAFMVALAVDEIDRHVMAQLVTEARVSVETGVPMDLIQRQRELYGAHTIGLFGIAELVRIALQHYTPPPLRPVRLRDLYPSREEVRRSTLPILRGSFIGAIFGMLPGSSAALASFTSYSIEKSVSPNKKEFGKGAIEGVAAPESANNSAVIIALVPLLCLGIPFSPVSALLLAGLQMHNVTPGPLLLQTSPEIFWGLIAAMYIGNVLLLVLNLPLVGLFARVATLKPHFLMPAVGIFCLIGCYAIRNAVFDIFVMIAAGILGVVLNRMRISVVPILLGMVLGSLLEDNLRVTIQWLNGDFSLVWSRPIALAILMLIPMYLILVHFAQRKVLKEEPVS